MRCVQSKPVNLECDISSSQHLIQSTVQFLTRYRHVNWALADQVMVSGVNFLTGILLARGLGIEEFGRFTLAWMVVLFVAGMIGVNSLPLT